jgi:hypothetical protein
VSYGFEAGAGAASPCGSTKMMRLLIASAPYGSGSGSATLLSTLYLFVQDYAPHPAHYLIYKGRHKWLDYKTVINEGDFELMNIFRRNHQTQPAGNLGGKSAGEGISWKKDIFKKETKTEWKTKETSAINWSFLRKEKTYR